MIFRSAMAIAFSVALAGCVDVPDFDSIGVTGDADDTLPIDVIVNHIACELHDVANRPENRILIDQNYVAVATLNLKVDDNGQVSPSLNFIHPFVTPSTSVGYGFSGQVGQTRQQTFAETLAFNLKEIAVATPEELSCPDPRARHRIAGINLDGNLGLAAAVTMGLKSFRGARRGRPVLSTRAKAPRWFVAPVTLSGNGAGFAQDSRSTGPAFGSIIQFTLSKGAGVAPTWTLTDFKGPSGPTGLFNYTRTNTHQVIIAFAPPAAPKANEHNFAEVLGAPAANNAVSSALNIISSMQINNIQLSQ